MIQTKSPQEIILLPIWMTVSRALALDTDSSTPPSSETDIALDSEMKKLPRIEMFEHIWIGSHTDPSVPDQPPIPCFLPLSGGIVYVLGTGQANRVRLAEPLDRIVQNFFWSARKVGKFATASHYDLSPSIELATTYALSRSNAYRLIDKFTVRSLIADVEDEVRQRNIAVATKPDAERTPHLMIVDADSISHDSSDITLFRNMIERGISDFAKKAGILLLVYGRKKNSLHEALELSNSTEWSEVTLTYKDQWSLVGTKNSQLPHHDLMKTLGYIWGISPRNSLPEAVWADTVAWYNAEVTQKDNDFLSIPVGMSENGDTLHFKLGDTSGVYHGFIVGTNGTGKTSFLNQIILGVCETYKPSEIELYLADLKQGVEFQYFADHPNCRRILLGEDSKADLLTLLREFAAQIAQRASAFRAKKLKNIAEYNEKHPEARLPHLILIVDEVQQLFSGTWSETEVFGKILEQVVRQGRGFGIHIILSTQTLTGANISKAIMSQIPLRISFKLIGSEIFQFFNTNNDAPSRLKKYEFVYNPEAGIREANIIAKAFEPRPIPAVIAQARARIGEANCLTPRVSIGSAQPSDEEPAPAATPRSSKATPTSVQLTDWNPEGLKL